jgi:hypothetical protein
MRSSGSTPANCLLDVHDAPQMEQLQSTLGGHSLRLTTDSVGEWPSQPFPNHAIPQHGHRSVDISSIHFATAKSRRRMVTSSVELRALCLRPNRWPEAKDLRAASMPMVMVWLSAAPTGRMTNRDSDASRILYRLKLMARDQILAPPETCFSRGSSWKIDVKKGEQTSPQVPQHVLWPTGSC